MRHSASGTRVYANAGGERGVLFRLLSRDNLDHVVVRKQRSETDSGSGKGKKGGIMYRYRCSRFGSVATAMNFSANSIPEGGV